MFDHDHDIPRAYTVPGIPHATASTLGAQWALQQAKALDEPVTLYAPGKQNLRDVETGRDIGPGRGVVIALWPDEKHLLEADESSGTAALVAVTWSPRETLGWAQAKHAEPLGGPKPDLTPVRPLDPVVPEAVDGLGILVGQHKTADQRYRAAVARGLTILLQAGYSLDPDALHTHAIGHGWRASNADILRDVAGRVNAGRVIQGMKTAPLADDVLAHWRNRAAARAESPE